MGRVTRPVGLRGELEVSVDSDDPERFSPGSTLLRQDDLRPLTIATVRRQGSRTIVSFEGVTDREGAEGLRGTVLVVDRGDVRELPEGRYWDFDLVGCEVHTLDGDRRGRVTAVIHAPDNDVLVVQTPEGERFVPLASKLVTEVDVGARRVVVDPVGGLLD